MLSLLLLNKEIKYRQYTSRDRGCRLSSKKWEQLLHALLNFWNSYQFLAVFSGLKSKSLMYQFIFLFVFRNNVLEQEMCF